MNTRELGALGEKLACEYLVEKGLKILGKNYTVPTGRQGIIWGEIDIIAKKKFKLFGKNDRVIHFVEVKTIIAQSGFHPEDKVDFKKQKKLRQLSEIWLKNEGFKENQPCQIDVIGVTISNDSKEPLGHSPTGEAKIAYFENVVSDV